MKQKTAVDFKQQWLITAEDWSELDLAPERIAGTARVVKVWKRADADFGGRFEALKRESESGVGDLVLQKAILGEIAARGLVYRALLAIKKVEAAEKPEDVPSAISSEVASAMIAAALKTMGIEAPDDLGREVYTAEQWAKWGR